MLIMNEPVIRMNDSVFLGDENEQRMKREQVVFPLNMAKTTKEREDFCVTKQTLIETVSVIDEWGKT